MRNNETMSKQSASNTNPNICTWCKDHIIYIAIALIACISMTSCNWFSGKSSDKLISFADSLIYGYYCSEDTMLLHYALKIYNETDSNKIDSRIAYTKLRVLFLLKHYSQGEEFVRSLDENIFFKPYHKKCILIRSGHCSTKKTATALKAPTFTAKQPRISKLTSTKPKMWMHCLTYMQ